MSYWSVKAFAVEDGALLHVSTWSRVDDAVECGATLPGTADEQAVREDLSRVGARYSEQAHQIVVVLPHDRN